MGRRQFQLCSGFHIASSSNELIAWFVNFGCSIHWVLVAVYVRFVYKLRIFINQPFSLRFERNGKYLKTEKIKIVKI